MKARKAMHCLRREPATGPLAGAMGGDGMRRRFTLIYQLKIVLEETRPQVMRRVQVPGDMDLGALHRAFQVAMGWTDSHLHAFTIAGKRYTRSREEGDLEELGMGEERGVRLCDLIRVPEERFSYAYDFGDDWQHTVTLEKVLAANPNTEYPVCLEGRRACPPEDCGGTEGYRDLLRVLRVPQHPQEAMRQWAGRKFDPEPFDRERVNRALRRLRV
jgi:hypothetical protein